MVGRIFFKTDYQIDNMVGYIIIFLEFGVMFWNVLRYWENRFKGALLKFYVAVTLKNLFNCSINIS